MQVPKDASNISIEDDRQLTFNTGDWEYDDSGKCIDEPARHCVFLGKGTYRFIAATDQITVEQMESIVDKVNTGTKIRFACYMKETELIDGTKTIIHPSVVYLNPVDSYKSLLLSQFINGRHAIIEVL